MTEATLTCVNHPDRPTTLRCNRCERPICSSCAVRTPVGYRCKECVRGQQAVFETAGGVSLFVAALVAGIGAGLATAILDSFGFWFWGLILAPIAGGGIAEIVRWAVRRRRSRRLPLSAAIGASVGVAIYTLVQVLPWLFFVLTGEPGFLSETILSTLLPIGYGALMIGALYARLRGIRL